MKTFLRFLEVIISIILICNCNTTAQSLRNLSASPVPLNKLVGNVYGTVKDKVTSEPVVDARVFLFNEETIRAMGYSYAPTQNLVTNFVIPDTTLAVRSGVTDTGGKFLVNFVPAPFPFRNYLIVVIADGYAPFVVTEARVFPGAVMALKLNCTLEKGMQTEPRVLSATAPNAPLIYRDQEAILPPQSTARRYFKTEGVMNSEFATREGLVGGTTANGHVIVADDHFASLPSPRVLCSNGGNEFQVEVTYGSKTVTVPVWDVGPWNTDDDYWNYSTVRQTWTNLTRGMPEAEAAYYDNYNGGLDQFGRTVTNPAGIDLADGTFLNDLGMTNNGWVTIDYLWSPDVKVGDNVQVTSAFNVRSSPGGSYVGIESAGAMGTITDGPQGATYGGTFYVWWKIQWQDGTLGWSIEEYIQKAAVSNIQVAIQTNPSGLTFTVDGSSYSSSQSLTWQSGSSHGIGTTSPQSGGQGIQYMWSSWSDGGAISHNISPSTNSTYTANFATQYYLTTIAGAGGSVNVASGGQNGGQVVLVTAIQNSGYEFAGWSGTGNGSYTGTTNPATITMKGPITESASFTMSATTHSITGEVSNGNGIPISAVTMVLTGSQSATTVTNAAGDYSFGSLPSGGNYTVIPSKLSYAFSPPSASFSNLTQNQVANFTGTLSGNPVVFSVPTNLQGGPGTTVSVPLIINPKGNDVGSFGVRLSFNNNILTYAGNYSQGPIVPGGWNINVNDSSSKGWVQIGALLFSGNTGITSSGTVLYLSFNVNPNASVGSTDSLIANNQSYLSASDTGANSLPVTATNGFFTVSQQTAQISGQLVYFSGDKALPGDTVTLFVNDSPTLSAQISGADGSFGFASVPLGSSDSLFAERISGNYPFATTITPTDALLAFQGRDGGPKALTGYQELAADVTGDGKVNPTDALAILKRAIGSFSSFEKYGVSDWIFVNSSFPISSGNWYSAPTYRVYSNLSGNQSSQGFVGIIRGDVAGSFGKSSGSNAIASDLAKSAASASNMMALKGTRSSNLMMSQYNNGHKEVASNSPVVFSIPINLSAQIGDTARVPININPDSNSVGSFGATLVFNNQLLSFDSLENGETDPTSDDWAIDANGNNSAGSVNVGAFNMATPTKPLRGSGAVAYLVFTVNESANVGDTTALELTNLSAADTGAVPLPVTGTNGKLTVLPRQPISLSLPVINGASGDTVLFPLNVEFLSGSSYSSAQLTIRGFERKLTFAGIAPDTGMIGKAHWIYEVNNTDTLTVTASAGAGNITGSGVLMWLKFFIPSNTDTGFVPIIIDTALFNTGMTPVSLTSGGIDVEQSILYGDVDMNGKVQAYDGALILKYLVGQIALDSAQLVRAKVSFDTTVSALDASLILKYVVGLIDTLPYSPDSLFNASGLIAMDSITVTPGETVQVSLYLTGGKNILSFDGQIAYDSTNLHLQGITWSSVNDNLMVYTSDSAGTIRFAGARSQPDSGSGVFADLAFKLNPNAAGPTAIVLQRLRWNEGALMKNVAKAVLEVTGVNEVGNKIPKEFHLSQNYPNPFNPTTVISYDLPKKSHVLVAVYDVLGREVKTLVDENQQAGSYRVTLDASDLPSGVYFYRITAGKNVQTKKLVLVK